VYNERENLDGFYSRLADVLAGLPAYDAEVVCVDDGSQDGSYEILQSLHRRDPRVKVLRLSRNFGSWNAIVAGLDAASGDAVMWISSDLQDPPELIPALLRKWESGAHVVWGVRSERHDPWPRRALAVAFYKLLRRIALPDYPPLGMDICLLDRRVAALLRGLREHNRFTQGLIMQLGFTQTRVSYVREPRRRGESKWGNLPRLSKIGMDMVAGFSSFPFRFMMYAGGLAIMLSLVLAAVLVMPRLIAGAPASPALVILGILFLGGANAVMLGVLGEYVWRILDEVRQRPLYVLQEQVGFTSDGADAGTRQTARRE
ncbi:MAG: glycosyltransferase family 2 protein, partial [bacterium]